MGVDPVCAHSVVLRRVHGPLPQRSTLPRCTSTIVHIPMWALRPPFLSAPIWSRWESSLSTWRKLVARSCLVRAEEILRLSYRIRHQLLSWSYSASTETHVRSALICSNAFCCSVPQVHWFPLQRRSLMLFVLSARCSENLLNWFTMPRNVLYDSCTFCGGGRSAIACSLWRSASIPRELMTCPRNLTLPVQHRQS